MVGILLKLSRKQIIAIKTKYQKPLLGKPFLAVTRNDELVAVDSNGLSDFPIKYSHTNEVAYDHPERLPNYIKKDVSRILRMK